MRIILRKHLNTLMKIFATSGTGLVSLLVLMNAAPTATQSERTHKRHTMIAVALNFILFSLLLIFSYYHPLPTCVLRSRITVPT